MTEKIVKVRKNNSCSHCGRDIKIGETALFNSFRSPRYDDDTQIGIEYIRYYLCFQCLSDTTGTWTAINDVDFDTLTIN